MLSNLLFVTILSSVASASVPGSFPAVGDSTPLSWSLASRSLVRKDTSSIERAVLDRMGPQLGGSSKNSSGELDSLGWPSNCTNACAPYTAVIEEKGICDTYSGVEANATCTSGYKMKIWDQCANLDKSTQCYYCVAPNRKGEMQTNVLNNLNTCKANGAQTPGSVEGIDMSKVSAGHYVATVSAASAFIAMGAGMLISLV